MLKRSAKAALCINCAVHDILRHLYPANLLLARSGPRGLAFPQIQRQFFEIVQFAGTDARFEEINWQQIIDNWDLPFPSTLKTSVTNPVRQEELDRAKAEGKQQKTDGWKPPLTEQEQRAKRRAELDHAVREILPKLNSKPVKK